MDFTKSPIRSADSCFFSFWENETIIADYLKSGKLKLKIIANSFKSPCINLPEKEITLSYPYLDYIWYFCFAFFNFQELINKKIKKSINYDYQINLNESFEGIQIQKCMELCNRILKLQDDSNASLVYPNDIVSPCNASFGPEIVHLEEVVNSLYSRAISFIVLHEIGHYENNHVAITTISPEEIKFCEAEADNFAINNFIRGTDEQVKNNSVGAELAFLSMFFMEKIGTVRHSITHPPVHDRCDRVISRLKDLTTDSSLIDYLYHFTSQLCLIFLFYRNDIPENLDAGSKSEDYYRYIMNKMDKYFISE